MVIVGIYFSYYNMGYVCTITFHLILLSMIVVTIVFYNVLLDILILNVIMHDIFNYEKLHLPCVDVFCFCDEKCLRDVITDIITKNVTGMNCIGW